MVSLTWHPLFLSMIVIAWNEDFICVARFVKIFEFRRTF